MPFEELPAISPLPAIDTPGEEEEAEEEEEEEEADTFEVSRGVCVGVGSTGGRSTTDARFASSC